MLIMEILKRVFVILIFCVPLNHLAFTPYKYEYKSGVISNEALPPEETEKELEKRQRYYEKFKTMKDDHLRSDGASGGEKKTAVVTEEVLVYHVEHQISKKNATIAIRKIPSDLLSPAGCEECTDKEKAYCRNDVINDHCCCDGKYSEVFAYVPHTCYLGATKCYRVAAECGEYMRLRTCCCEKMLRAEWRDILLSNASFRQPHILIMLGIIIIGALKSSCL